MTLGRFIGGEVVEVSVGLNSGDIVGLIAADAVAPGTFRLIESLVGAVDERDRMLAGLRNERRTSN